MHLTIPSKTSIVLAFALLSANTNASAQSTLPPAPSTACITLAHTAFEITGRELVGLQTGLSCTISSYEANKVDLMPMIENTCYGVHMTRVLNGFTTEENSLNNAYQCFEEGVKTVVEGMQTYKPETATQNRYEHALGITNAYHDSIVYDPAYLNGKGPHKLPTYDMDLSPNTILKQCATALTTLRNAHDDARVATATTSRCLNLFTNEYPNNDDINIVQKCLGRYLGETDHQTALTNINTCIDLRYPRTFGPNAPMSRP